MVVERTAQNGAIAAGWRHAGTDPDDHVRFARGRLLAMRVYLGGDHAGFELKQQIIEHLNKRGDEPIDCGALVYDAADDYPAADCAVL